MDTTYSDGSLNDSRDDLAAYALNALEPGERDRVERLLAVSEEARQELLELQEGAEAVSMVAGEATPPAGLRERLLDIAAGAPLHVVGKRAALDEYPDIAGQGRGWMRAWLSFRGFAYAGSAAAVAGIVALAAFFGMENARLSGEVDDLNSQLSEQQTQIASLETSLRDLRRLTYVTQSGGFNVSQWLAGSHNAPEADGTLYVSPSEDRAMFSVYGLPVQPEGKEYHLWLEGAPDIRNDVAIFTVNETGQASVEFTLPRSIQDYDRAVVTLEDAETFLPAPTGEEVLSSP